MAQQALQFESIEKKGISAGHLGELIAAADANDSNGEGGRVLEEAERQIQIVAEHENPQERSAFLIAVKKQLDSARFQQKERAKISHNLEELQKRVKGKEPATQAVQELRQAATVERSTTEPPPLVVPDSESERSPSDAKPDQNPPQGPNGAQSAPKVTDWSEKTKTTLKATAVGVAVAAIAYGLYKVGRWIWGGAKKATDTTVSWARRIGRGILTVGILAGAGLAGFLGYKAIAHSWLGKLNKAGEVAKEKYEVIERELQVLRLEKEALEQRIASAEENVRDQWNQQLTQVNSQMAALQQQLDQSRSELVQGDTQTEGEQSESEDEQKPIETEVTQKQDTAEQLIAKGTIPFIARGLVAFENVRGWEQAEQTKVLHVTDVMTSAKERPMSEVFASVEGRTVKERLFKTQEDMVSHDQAQILIVRYCLENHGRLKDGGKTDAEVGAMPLEEFLQEIAGTYSAAGKVLEQLRANKGNPIEALKGDALNIGKLMEEEGGLVQECESFVREKQLQVSALQLAQALPQFTISVGEFIGRNSNFETLEPVELSIYALCQEMNEMKTHLYMIPFFHRLFPEEQWSDNMEENQEVARKILFDRMNLFQAVRMHFYARMMRHKNPAGVVLMQAEIFKYVVDRDPGLLGSDWLKNRDIKMIDRIVHVAASGTWDEWKELPIEIDDQLVKQALKNMGFATVSIAKVALGAVAAGAGKGALTGATLSVEHPWLVGLPVGGAFSYIALQRYLAHRANAIPLQTLTRLHKMESNHEIFMKIMRAARVEFTRDAVTQARVRLSTISQDIDKLINNQKTLSIGLELNRALGNCTTATIQGSESAWEQFLQTAQLYRGTSRRVDRIIEEIRYVRNNTNGVRDAISAAARPVIGRVRQWIGLPGRVLDKGIASIPYVGRFLGTTVRKMNQPIHIPGVGMALKGAPLALGGGLATALELANKDVDVAQVKERRLNLIGELDNLCRSATDEQGEAIFEKQTDTDGKVTYVLHGARDVAISIGQLQELHNEGDAASAGWAKAGVEAGSTLFILGATAAGSGGLAIPVIVTVLAAHKAIDMAQEAVERERRRKFLQEAPVWLIAVLGTENIFQSGELNEFTMLEENAGGAPQTVAVREAAGYSHPLSSHASDMDRSEADTQRQKKVAREKLCQALAFRKFIGLHDEMLAELPGEGDLRQLFNPEGQFLKENGDYQNFVRKFAVLQLLAECKGHPVTLADIDALDLTASGGFLFTQYRLITEIDVTQALRRGMLFYVQHLREKRYKEALKQVNGDAESTKVLEEGVSLSPQYAYVFNVHPKDLPTIGSEETYAERILREMYATAQSAGSSAPDAVSKGYVIPGGGAGEGSIGNFLANAVDPKFHELQRTKLESYQSTNGRGLPFGLSDLDAWEHGEAFAGAWNGRVKRYEELNRSIEGSMFDSEEQLHSFAATFKPEELVEYLRFQEHRGFYEDYIAWRAAKGVGLPADYSQQVKLLQAWMDRGKPTLVDERQFAHAQQTVRTAMLGSEVPGSAFSTLLPGTRPSPLDTTGTTLAGYDAKKPGRLLFTLEGYFTQREHALRLMEAQEQQKGKSQILDRGSQRLPFPLPGEKVTGVELRLSSSKEPSIPSSLPPDLQDQVSGRVQEIKAIDAFGSFRPVALLNGLRMDKCIAVPERELHSFFQSWRKNDGYDDLRMSILRKRVFVVVELKS